MPGTDTQDHAARGIRPATGPGADAGDRSTIALGVWIVAAAALVALLYFGRPLLVPIALAATFALLLRPVVRGLHRLRLPEPAAAALVVLAIFGGLGGGIFFAAQPVQAWAQHLPESLRTAQGKLQRFRKPFETLNRAAQQVEQATSGSPSGGQDGQGGASRSAPPPAQSSGGPTLFVRIFGTTTAVISGIVEVLLLLYFLLASGDLFLRRLMHGLRRPGAKRTAVAVAHEIESVISGYLFATLLINVGQGICVGIAMWLLGMPQPVLWGLLTLVLEFIPYLGGALMVILLTIVAFATFDQVGKVLLTPGLYLLITTLQNNIVSPLVYGRRLQLHPVAIFVGVLFWYLLWGVPGAFLAVPILAAVKISADHTERFAVVGEFLGEERGER